MNAKHYVSLKAAKKLKEINHDGLNYTMHIGNDEIIYPAYVVGDVYPAPTLLEAMDWLEERGVKIGFYHTSYSGWCYTLNNRKSCYISETESTNRYTDRNECMQKAIEKALELL